MYVVSDDFLEAVQKNTRKYYWSGTITTTDGTVYEFDYDDIETYRDVLYYVAQVLGGFFVINREGKLELRKYGSDPVMEITQEQRFSSSFSDFITRYTAISSTNSRTETAEYYAVDPDDALIMNLETNPLLQFGLTETREQLLTNILNDLQEVNYVPFDSEIIGNPALDLGDILTFFGTISRQPIASSKTFCDMQPSASTFGRTRFVLSQQRWICRSFTAAMEEKALISVCCSNPVTALTSGKFRFVFS